MFLIRDVFQAKPGKAKELAAIFRKSNEQLMQDNLIGRGLVMTDFVGNYWTVVCQTEVEDLQQYTEMVRGYTQRPEVADLFKGYMDLVTGGHREIYKME